MIKRLRFANRRSGVSADELAAGWRAAADLSSQAPADVRPRRIGVSMALPEYAEPTPLHDAVGVEAFDDHEQLDRYRGWLTTLEGQGAESLIQRLVQPSGPVIVVEERVMRGDGWLAAHRRGAGSAFQHIAIAIRAVGLSPAEFSAAWSGHAGTVRAADKPAPVAIPAEVRGQAYLQNHPIAGGDWPYDAINEVFFDDLASLERRIAWFRDNMDSSAQEDLFSKSWFIAAREETLYSG